MKTILIVLMGILVAGCATSTGVIPMGQNTYMVSNRSMAPGASLGAAKAAVLVEAKDFCQSKGNDFKTLNTTDVPRSFGQMPEAAIQFECVPK